MGARQLCNRSTESDVLLREEEEACGLFLTRMGGEGVVGIEGQEEGV